MRFIISVKHQGTNPVFYGPFESRQQADDWSDGARRAWPDAAILVLPLESPWDA